MSLIYQRPLFSHLLTSGEQCYTSSSTPAGTHDCANVLSLGWSGSRRSCVNSFAMSSVLFRPCRVWLSISSSIMIPFVARIVLCSQAIRSFAQSIDFVQSVRILTGFHCLACLNELDLSIWKCLAVNGSSSARRARMAGHLLKPVSLFYQLRLESSTRLPV